MFNRILKYFLITIFVILGLLFYKQIYYFIITYHIIIYIMLVFLPLTTLAKKSLTVPFIVFIQFFWAVMGLALLSFLPLYKVLVLVKLTLFYLSSLLVF